MDIKNNIIQEQSSELNSLEKERLQYIKDNKHKDELINEYSTEVKQYTAELMSMKDLLEKEKENNEIAKYDYDKLVKEKQDASKSITQLERKVEEVMSIKKELEKSIDANNL